MAERFKRVPTLGWHVHIRGDFGELYWMELKNGSAADCLMEQRIDCTDKYKLKNRQSPALFAN